MTLRELILGAAGSVSRHQCQFDRDQRGLEEAAEFDEIGNHRSDLELDELAHHLPAGGRRTRLYYLTPAIHRWARPL